MASHNPANTADIIGHVVRTEPEQVPELMARAQAAQGVWAQRPVQERAEILERIGHLFEANTTELLALLTREAGKSWADAVAELRGLASAVPAERSLVDELLADRRVAASRGE